MTTTKAKVDKNLEENQREIAYETIICLHESGFSYTKISKISKSYCTNYCSTLCRAYDALKAEDYEALCNPRLTEYDTAFRWVCKTLKRDYKEVKNLIYETRQRLNEEKKQRRQQEQEFLQKTVPNPFGIPASLVESLNDNLTFFRRFLSGEAASDAT